MTVTCSKTEFRQSNERPSAVQIVAKAGLLPLILARLEDLETVLHRMILGIWHFVTQTMPWWTVRQLIELGHIAVKAARVAAIFLLWFAITGWPLPLLWAGPGKFWSLLLLGWIALALSGSVWGAIHVRRRRFWKERSGQAASNSNGAAGLNSPNGKADLPFAVPC